MGSPVTPWHDSINISLSVITIFLSHHLSGSQQMESSPPVLSSCVAYIIFSTLTLVANLCVQGVPPHLQNTGSHPTSSKGSADGLLRPGKSTFTSILSSYKQCSMPSQSSPSHRPPSLLCHTWHLTLLNPHITTGTCFTVSTSDLYLYHHSSHHYSHFFSFTPLFPFFS